MKVEKDNIKIRVGGGYLSIDEFLDLLKSTRMKALARTSPLYPVCLTFKAVYLVTDSPKFTSRMEYCLLEYGRGNYKTKHEDENNLKYCKKIG